MTRTPTCTSSHAPEQGTPRHTLTWERYTSNTNHRTVRSTCTTCSPTSYQLITTNPDATSLRVWAVTRTNGDGSRIVIASSYGVALELWRDLMAGIAR